MPARRISGHVSETQVERRQEGDHSLVSRACAGRTVGGPYVSCVLRVREITPIFENPVDSQAFMRCFASILNPDELAKQLGFWRHPLYQEAVQAGKKYRDKRMLAAILMYSLDPSSQHARLQAMKKKRERKRDQINSAVKQYRLKAAAVRSRLPLQDAVEQDAIASHLETLASTEGRSFMLSVPKSQAMALQNLEASLAVSESNVVPAIANDLRLDVDESIVPAPAEADLLFFAQCQCI